jgi:hypothetical protein
MAINSKSQTIPINSSPQPKTNSKSENNNNNNNSHYNLKGIVLHTDSHFTVFRQS